MNHYEQMNKVTANLIRKTRKVKSHKSWLIMRNYLEQLDREQLKALLKEAA